MPKPRLTEEQRKAEPAKKTTGKRGRPAMPKAEDDKDGERYEVEAIVDDGIDQDTLEHLYLIKWRGYDAEQNTWEPKPHLKGAEDVIRAYEKVKLKPKSKNKRGKASE